MKVIERAKVKYAGGPYDQQKGKFLGLNQLHRNWPWGMDREDGFDHGEFANKAAEDPSDYSVDQFINTDDAQDDDDEEVNGKHKFSGNQYEQGHDVDNFSENEVADDDE